MWIVRNKETKEVLRKSTTPFSIDGEVKGLDPELEILEVKVINNRPEYDATTHKLEIEAQEAEGVITESYKPVLLTPEEKVLKDKNTAEYTAKKESRARALGKIIEVKDDPFGAILYDLAVSRGDIVDGKVNNLSAIFGGI